MNLETITNTISGYITTEFVEFSNRKTHESYCSYPWENCSCQGKPSITVDSPLISSGYLDSFSIATVVVFLEKTFKISVPDDQIVPSNFETVTKISNLVESLLAETSKE